MDSSLARKDEADRLVRLGSGTREKLLFGRRDALTTSYNLLTRLENWDDQKSWKDFFDRYWKLIYSMAIRSGLTEAEAEDVVQETIVCVAKDVHKFQQDRKRGTFKGWLRKFVNVLGDTNNCFLDD